MRLPTRTPIRLLTVYGDGATVTALAVSAALALGEPALQPCVVPSSAACTFQAGEDPLGGPGIYVGVLEVAQVSPTAMEFPVSLGIPNVQQAAEVDPDGTASSFAASGPGIYETVEADAESTESAFALSKPAIAQTLQYAQSPVLTVSR